MRDDIEQLLADVKHRLRVDSARLYEVRIEMTACVKQVEMCLSAESLTAQHRARHGETYRVPDLDSPPEIEDESSVYAVFMFIPPDLVDSDIDIGEVVKLNQTAFATFSGGPLPCARMATPEEMNAFDDAADLRRTLSRNDRWLSTALLLSAARAA